MKYQLLLLTIYLITITYSQDTCNSYKTSATCTGNCQWTETKAGSCAQTSTKTCTDTLVESDCTGACTFTEKAGKCESLGMTDESCATALTEAKTADNTKVCADIPGCVEVESSCKAITVTDESCAADLTKAKSTDNTKVCADIVGCEDVGGTCKAKTEICKETEKASCTKDGRCKWTITSASCTDTCQPLSTSTECNGKNSLCTWTEGTGTCATKKEEGSDSGSGSGSGSGTGTTTGTSSESEEDSSYYVKFGKYILVLFLFLF